MSLGKPIKARQHSIFIPMKPSQSLPRISDYVSHFALKTPSHEAVIFNFERITYDELAKRVERCARALIAAGIKKGDRVAMLSTPRPEYWTVFLATARIGAIWVGLNPKFRLDELRYVVGDCKPRLIFSISSFEGREYAQDVITLMQESDDATALVSISGEMNGVPDLDEFLQVGENLSNEDYQSACEAVDRFDPALIVYTSGSTGKPKGAVLSHHGLSFGALVQSTHFRLKTPRMVVSFPIDHVACVADSCATTLVNGGAIIFQERFNPQTLLEATEREKVTFWVGIPTMIQQVLALPDFDSFDLSSIELVLWGGAALPRNSIARLQQMGPRLLTAYGMTETSAHVTFTDDNADIDVLSETIGKPDANSPCRIVNDEGEDCATGEQGELQFKCDHLMLEYFKQPDKSREAFTKDGWMHTGDIGYWRADGNIKLTGRISDMFKSGGYNVFPREIEVVLEELPAVAMAAVISVPDNLYQEVGHAYLLLETSEEVSEQELIAYCKQRLANYKVPKRFFLQTALPMLPVGKIDKRALKRAASDATK